MIIKVNDVLKYTNKWLMKIKIIWYNKQQMTL